MATSPIAGLTPPVGGTSSSTLSEWAGPYVTDMLGKAQAIADQPYQVYGGPQTAGESGLQSKVFQGLGNLSFPSVLGQSFASPMGGRQQPPMMLNQGSNGFGDFGNMQATTGLQNQGPAGGNFDPFQGQAPQTYEDYLESVSMFHALPQTREQFESGQKQLGQQRQQGMEMLGRGNMNEIMAGLGGKPGQMPQGGLASLISNFPQQKQQPEQSVAQRYMNHYLESVLTPQLEELRRQSQINVQPGLAKLTQAGGFGGGRQAIMESEANRNLLQAQNQAIGTGYSNAYDKAMQQFNTEQGQAKTLADLMGQAGQTQRGIEQEGITADYNEFLAQRDYPQKMLQLQQSMLQGLPISTVSTSPASMTGLGALQSTVGTLGSTYDLLKKLKVIE